MNKEKTTVRVAGQTITIVSTEGETHVRRVAAFADRKLTETMQQSRQSEQTSAILALLDVCDELLKAQDDNTRLRRENWELNQQKEKQKG